MSIQYREKAFESGIEDYLLTYAGYSKGEKDAFDPERCLDLTALFAFIKETQPEKWEYLSNLHKKNAEKILLDDLCRALASEYEGCLSVLRHGFKCFGKLFQMAYFSPASGLNPETQKLYAANRLTVTRQAKYSNKHSKTIDLLFCLNGMPVATAELKNPLTGQTWQNAVYQYQNDRDPHDLIFQFTKRSLVHFAVDPDGVYMTTRLEGKATRFLPFNLGNEAGAGNPENPGGYKTHYLWEQVWQRDSFLDILARFVHLQKEEKRVGDKIVKTEKMLFPRYHQLDAVRKLVKDARTHGAGHNYLVQHSAGSGKSNSIAWLAYRLASLYNAEDQKLFDSVIVITDRLVLDQQLQGIIYGFEHKQGVVQKIEIDSAQLANALVAGTPIVITTLQKFPFVTEKIGELPTRKYAVIIDEAHSSQSGEGAIELKRTLAGTMIKEAAAAQANEEGLIDHEEEILRAMAKRGRQPNISFFAFSATPKYKTLEVFGHPGPEGKPVPFHLYSMRQAIEEGFILDVLKNYVTYKTYYRLIKSIEDDPKVDKKKAARALARFMSLHPHNIAQKTEVMVEHFQHFTRHKIGGRAKAMVVTSSRLHAVRYKQAFDKYIAEKGYTGITTLVAFSGTVIDPDIPDKEYSEVGMNKGIKEKELPEKFATDEYQVLLAAEKYQTGFDQPLLHTMYVDKKLAGVQAVQTLSRLNRTHYAKEDTFVLDFVNEPTEITDAFQPYYEQTTVGERAQPEQLYELQAKLDAQQVYYGDEVEEFSKIFYKPQERQTPADHAKLNACIDPAVTRFRQLDEDTREEYRKWLVAYRNLYSFLSQVIPFQDSDLEKRYSYIRFLLTKLPRRTSGDSYNLDEEVKLEYYRLQKISEGALTLQSGKGGEVSGPTSVGGDTARGDTIQLSQLIDILNERFSTDFTPADQLFFDSVRESAVADSALRQAALANTIENFSYIFRRALEELFIDRLEQNEEITAKYLNDKEFQQVVQQTLVKQVYEQIREELATIKGEKGDEIGDSTERVGVRRQDEPITRECTGVGEEFFDRWLESLPYPLSRILWRYKAKNVAADKVRLLITFFESLAAFNSIVALSALAQDEALYVRECLAWLDKDTQKSFNKPNFGDWSGLASRLAKATREMRQDPKKNEKLSELFGGPGCEELIQAVTRKKLYTVLSRAANYRNKWKGHGSDEVSDEDHEERLKELNKLLTEVHTTICHRYASVLMFTPKSHNMERDTEGARSYTVKVWKGTRTNPIQEAEVECSVDLKRDSLYLAYVPENGPIQRPIPLLPFIVLKECKKADDTRPRVDNYAFYLYSGRGDSKVRWLSQDCPERHEIESGEGLKLANEALSWLSYGKVSFSPSAN